MYFIHGTLCNSSSSLLIPLKSPNVLGKWIVNGTCPAYKSFSPDFITIEFLSKTYRQIIFLKIHTPAQAHLSRCAWQMLSILQACLFIQFSLKFPPNLVPLPPKVPFNESLIYGHGYDGFYKCGASMGPR